MPIIQVNQLSKSYGSHEVLKGIDLSVEPGKLIGFLGPNGAGKTTTIRILLGLLSANSGSANLFGQCSRKFGNKLRARVGYLPGDVHLYSNLTGRKMLRFLADARKIKVDDEIDRLSSAFDLELDKIVRKYSTGMRQKLGLIQALMHQPDLLILDEPTSALDPLVRKSVFAELKKVVKEGRTVLFSSHSLAEVEQLCDEAVILRSGRIVEHQQIDLLQERALKVVEIHLAHESDWPEALPNQLHVLEREVARLRLTWKGKVNELLAWLNQFPISDLTIQRPDLNDLFITYYTEGDTDHV